MRAIARGLYGRSPSCRSSARTATRTRPGSRTTSRSPIRQSCCSRPITTCTACSTARASRSSDLGVPRREAARSRPIRASLATFRRELFTCSAARRRWLWLDHVFGEGVRPGRGRLSAGDRRSLLYDAIGAALATARVPAARAVRAIQHRSAGDDRSRRSIRSTHHRKIRASGWHGRVIHRLPAGPRGRSGARGLSPGRCGNSASSPARTSIPGRAISKRTACAAPTSADRRDATDHGHPTARTADLRQPRRTPVRARRQRRGSTPERPNCSARRC